MNKKFIFYLLVACFISCGAYDPPVAKTKIKNKTQDTIYVLPSYATYLTLNDSTHFYEMKSFYKIGPHQTDTIPLVWWLMSTNNNESTDTVVFFIISNKTVRDKEWSDIHKYQLYKNKIEIPYRKLKWCKRWRLTYEE